MPPAPTNNKAEHVFPVGAAHQLTYRRHTHSTHTDTGKRQGLVLVPSPPDQDEGPSWEIQTRIQCGSLQQLGLVSLSSGWLLDPSLPSCWHLDIGAPEAAALLLLVFQTPHSDTHKCTPIRCGLCSSWLCTSSPPVADPGSLVFPGASSLETPMQTHRWV